MKLLVTWGDTYSDEEKKKLESIGYDVHYIAGDKELIDESKLDFRIEDIDVVVCGSIFNDTDISKFKKLKFIKTYSAGIDYMPHEYINKNGIILENAKNVFGIPIAEYIVMKVLEINKSAKILYENQKENKWKIEKNIVELTDKVVTIIGYGGIGIQTAKRLKAFGVKIRAIVGSNINEDSRQYVDEIYTAQSTKSLLLDSDIVILTLPYSQSSHHLIDEEAIASMKDDAMLINIARGKIIDEVALIAALKKGKFKGVALDVFYSEPLDKDSPLWQFDNVSVTPHISYMSQWIDDRQFESVYNGVKGFYDKSNA